MGTSYCFNGAWIILDSEATLIRWLLVEVPSRGYSMLTFLISKRVGSRLCFEQLHQIANLMLDQFIHQSQDVNTYQQTKRPQELSGDANLTHLRKNTGQDGHPNRSTQIPSQLHQTT
jgi:hypothetical protein